MVADEKRITTEDIPGVYGFRLVWSVSNMWADVAVYELADFDGDEAPEAGHEPYLSGYVKWDGCTELNQGQPHWCGPAQYVAHCALLKHIYLRAFALMGCEPDEAWPE